METRNSQDTLRSNSSANEPTPRSEEFKLWVSQLIEQLTDHMINSANYSLQSGHSDVLCERLFSNVWVEVQDEDCDVSRQNLRTLHRVIYTRLCRRFEASGRFLLYFLLMDDAVINDIIVSIVKEALMNPPKKSNKKPRMTRFFLRLFKSSSVHTVRKDEEAVELQKVKSVHTVRKDEEAVDSQESKTSSSPPSTVSEASSITQKVEPEPKRQPSKEDFKFRVDVLVEQLTFYIFQAANYGRQSDKFEIVFERLFKKVWAEVQNENCDVSKHSLRSLYKDIYRRLCRRFRSSGEVLLNVLLDGSEMDSVFVSTVKEALMEPPEFTMMSVISRFFMK